MKGVLNLYISPLPLPTASHSPFGHHHQFLPGVSQLWESHLRILPTRWTNPRQNLELEPRKQRDDDCSWNQPRFKQHRSSLLCSQKPADGHHTESFVSRSIQYFPPIYLDTPPKVLFRSGIPTISEAVARLSHASYMTRPSQPPRFHHRNNIYSRL